MPRRSRTLLLAAAALALLGACRERLTPVVEASNASDASRAPVSSFPCVRFEDLRRHLPRALEGYRTTRDEGSSGRYGEVSISEAERLFSGEDDKEISVRIVDTTLVDDLGRAIRAAARDASDRKAASPTAPILGQSTVGFVRYDSGRQRAEANLLVADRFVVAITSRGIEGTEEVRRVADQMDLTGLALLR